MNYLSSPDSLSGKPAISKSAVAEKMLISKQNLYYQPKLPTKDLKLKNKIEAVMIEHNAYSCRKLQLA